MMTNILSSPKINPRKRGLELKMYYKYIGLKLPLVQ